MSQALNKPSVLLIPIGSTTTAEIRRDLEDAVGMLGKLDLNLSRLEPIANRDQAQQTAGEVRNRNVDLVVLLALHGLTADIQVATASQFETPALIWALPERHSLSTSASAIGGLRDLDRPIRLIYGRAGDRQIGDEIALTAKSAFALNRMRKARIGEIGGLYPVLVASKYHEDTLAQKLGPRLMHISLNETRSFLQGVDEGKIREATESISKTFQVNADRETVRKGVKFHLALKALAEKYDLSGIAVNCYGELIREFEATPCLGFIDDIYVVGCEGDVVAMSMLLLSRYMTGKDGFLADFYTVEEDGTLVMVNCAGAASLSDGGEKTTIDMGGSTVDMPVPLAFCRPTIPKTQVTVARFFGRNIDKLHMATGEVVSCSTKDAVLLRIRLKKDIREFMDKICNAHYIVFPDDVSQHLAMFCRWNDIQIV